MAENPSAIVQFWEAFKAGVPEAHRDDIVLSGIYANKSGYHNTRANHLRNRPNDYSIQAALDKLGPSDKAAAIDITFRSAQRSDFRIIRIYTQRMINAMRDRDERLWYAGKPILREVFGNADLDREVEGWSLYRGRAATSDDSHLWHMHLSWHRWAVENWTAALQILSILLGKPIVQPEPGEDMPTAEEIVKALMAYRVELTEGERERYEGYPEAISVKSLLVHAGAGGWDIERGQQGPEGIEQRRYDVLILKLNQLLERLSEESEEPPAPRTYTVVAGDTLSEIAERFGTTVEILASLNGISDPSKLSVGQVLNLP